MMTHRTAHILAETAITRLMDEMRKAQDARAECSSPQPALTREEALARISECAQRATAVWRASGIFINSPLADAVHELSRVRAMYMAVMGDIGTHIQSAVTH